MRDEQKVRELELDITISMIFILVDAMTSWQGQEQDATTAVEVSSAW